MRGKWNCPCCCCCCDNEVESSVCHCKEGTSGQKNVKGPNGQLHPFGVGCSLWCALDRLAGLRLRVIDVSKRCRSS